MELIKFTNMLKGKDAKSAPFRIPAKDLDSNFAKLRPLSQDGNARQYAIIETPNGWFLKLFPDGTNSTTTGASVLPKAPSSGTYVLGSQNGTIVWLATEAC